MGMVKTVQKWSFRAAYMCVSEGAGGSLHTVLLQGMAGLTSP